MSPIGAIVKLNDNKLRIINQLYQRLYMNFRTGFNFFKQAKSFFSQPNPRHSAQPHLFSSVKTMKTNIISPTLSNLLLSNNALLVQNIVKLLEKARLSPVDEQLALSICNEQISIVSRRHWCSLPPIMRHHKVHP